MTGMGRLLLAFLGLTVTIVPASWAQRSAAPDTLSGVRGFATSFGIERLRLLSGDENYAMAVLRTTTLKPDAAGLEIGLSVAHAGGYLFFMPEAGAAWNVGVGRGSLLLRGGVSTLMIFVPGIYLGASALVPVGDGVGIRLDLTHRVLVLGEERTGLISFGIAFALLEPPRPCPCR